MSCSQIRMTAIRRFLRSRVTLRSLSALPVSFKRRKPPGLGKATTFGTVVPETAVDEDRQPVLREIEIRISPYLASVKLPAAHFGSDKSKSKTGFGAQVPFPSDCSHLSRPSSANHFKLSGFENASQFPFQTRAPEQVPLFWVIERLGGRPAQRELRRVHGVAMDRRLRDKAAYLLDSAVAATAPGAKPCRSSYRK